MAILAGQKVLDSHLCPPPVNSSRCGYRHTPVHQTYMGAGSELRPSCTTSTLRTEPFPQSQSNDFFIFFSYYSRLQFILSCRHPLAPSHGAGAFDKIYRGPNCYCSTFYSSPLLFLRAVGSWGEEDRINNGVILHPRFPHSVTAVTWSLTGSGRVTSVLFSADVKWESKWFRR